jgi:hypothetical protein
VGVLTGHTSLQEDTADARVFQRTGSNAGGKGL